MSRFYHPDDEEGFQATELQDAFALSQHERIRPDETDINAAVEQGKFAVVSLSVSYCPRTDAILPGYDRRLVSTHDLLNDAEHEARCLNDQFCEDSDVTYVVVSRKPAERSQEPIDLII